MVNMQRLSPQVLVAGAPIVPLGKAENDFLKTRLSSDGIERIRICCHRSSDDHLHEMLMAFTSATYVRPSLHMDKDESLLFLEGFATLFFFDAVGNVTDQIALGPIASGRSFYCRVPAHTYHGLVIESDQVLIKETASGPFMPEYTKFPNWAPDGTDPSAVSDYLNLLQLRRRF